MKRAGPSRHATAGIVLLHGRGGSAADILSLMAHAALPDIAAIAPEAPGNSWWPTSFLAPSAQMDPFVSRALSQVTEAVAALQGEIQSILKALAAREQLIGNSSVFNDNLQ